MKNFESKTICPCDTCIKSDVCFQKGKVQELKNEIEEIANKLNTDFLQLNLKCNNFCTKINNPFIQGGIR